MDVEVVLMRLAALAIPVGAGAGAVVAVILGSTWTTGAFAGVTSGVITVAIIVALFEFVDDAWLSDGREVALAAVVGSLVASPVASAWALQETIAIASLLVILLTGAALGGFLGYVYPDASAPG